MLTDRANEVVNQATPSKRVSLILTVHPIGSALNLAEDRKKRVATLSKFYSRKKQPILKHFGTYESSGLRVVNNLVGTPNLIVSAPARVWKRLMREQPKVFSDPAVEVTANEPDFVTL
ncbi:hypothetical protein AB5I39_08560 [Sphingomonas sp. MMS24-J45]|uniref:hypothetical protein n=1 Tax=Sphingomonas sp. MMS24-J45 TaxID=3238806 RepID=UPI00384CF2BF